MAERSINDIADSELVRRAIRELAGNPSRHYLWVRVMDMFSLSDKFATQLCIKHGFDPDQTKYVEPKYQLATAQHTIGAEVGGESLI